MVTQPRRPWMPAFLQRLVGEQDPIDQQLDHLARQGSTMARVSHACATLLVVLFSAGSLVALGADALAKIMSMWQSSHQLDIPSIITVSVSTLMVLAMDVAMLQAAHMLRLLSSRRSRLQDRALHIVVMAGVAALESGTYFWMSWQYEHPASTAAAALILARALAAPFLAIYLAMSRVLPITSRDILAQAELASGAGVLRDVTQAARDPLAPLDRKMRLYGSAAVMTPADRGRLDAMIAAVMQEQPGFTGHIIQARQNEALESPYTAAYDGAGLPGSLPGPIRQLPRLAPSESALSASGDGPERPPTGPGSPAAKSGRRKSSKSAPAALVRITPADSRPGRRAAARGHQLSAQQRVRAIWQPGLSISQIEQMAGVSRSTAHKWNQVILAEQDHPQADIGQVAK